MWSDTRVAGKSGVAFCKQLGGSDAFPTPYQLYWLNLASFEWNPADETRWMDIKRCCISVYFEAWLQICERRFASSYSYFTLYAWNNWATTERILMKLDIVFFDDC